MPYQNNLNLPILVPNHHWPTTDTISLSSLPLFSVLLWHWHAWQPLPTTSTLNFKAPKLHWTTVLRLWKVNWAVGGIIFKILGGGQMWVLANNLPRLQEPSVMGVTEHKGRKYQFLSFSCYLFSLFLLPHLEPKNSWKGIHIHIIFTLESTISYLGGTIKISVVKLRNLVHCYQVK